MVPRTDTTTTDLVPLCAHLRCLVRRSFGSPRAIGDLEVVIMDRVGDAVDNGWAPEELVDEIDRLSRRGPCAGQIVTLALVCHAGYWMNARSMFGLLDQVDELAAGFHHLVGLTIPGWLDRYAHQDVGIERALDGVIDVLDALDTEPMQRRRMLPPLPDGHGSVRTVWRRHRP